MCVARSHSTWAIAERSLRGTSLAGRPSSARGTGTTSTPGTSSRSRCPSLTTPTRAPSGSAAQRPLDSPDVDAASPVPRTPRRSRRGPPGRARPAASTALAVVDRGRRGRRPAATSRRSRRRRRPRLEAVLDAPVEEVEERVHPAGHDLGMLVQVPVGREPRARVAALPARRSGSSGRAGPCPTASRRDTCAGTTRGRSSGSGPALRGCRGGRSATRASAARHGCRG